MIFHNILQVEARVPAEVIKFGQPGVSFVCVKRTSAIEGMFIKANKLVFQKKEVDSATGEVYDEVSEEEYPLDELEVRAPVCVRARVHARVDFPMRKS